jgi:hypothetical protein
MVSNPNAVRAARISRGDDGRYRHVVDAPSGGSSSAWAKAPMARSPVSRTPSRRRQRLGYLPRSESGKGRLKA